RPPSGGAWDATDGLPTRAFRRAPTLWSKVDPDSPDDRGRRRSWPRGPHLVLRARRSRPRNRDTSYARRGTVATPHSSIDVLLVAAPFLQLGDEQRRFLWGANAVLGHDVHQRPLDVLGHAFGVATYVNVSAVRDPLPEVCTDFAHAILNIDFLF